MADTLVATAGASNSDSYNTLAELEAHFVKFGAPTSGWTGATDDAKCVHARIATSWMDPYWNWIGLVTDVETPQALAWPREGATDRDGRILSITAIPVGIKALHAWVTRFVAEGKIQVDAESGQLIIVETVDVISTTFDPYRRAASFLDFLGNLASRYTSGAGLRLFSNGG